MSISPIIFRTCLILLVFAGSCTSVPASLVTPTQELRGAQTSTSQPVPTWTLPLPMIETTLIQNPGSAIALTHQRMDGNRLVSGSGGMPTEPIDIPLLGKPLWVVAAPLPAGTIWVATLEDGQVQAFQVNGSIVSEITLNISRLPAGMPPALQVVGERVDLLSPSPDASAITHPVVLEDGAQAYIDADGQLRLIRQEAVHMLEVNALPDARILSDGTSRLLFLSTPTAEYPHGVLGDEFESKTITLVDTSNDLRVLRVIQIDPGDVIEGIAPIWVDLDGDGEREIILTQSNAASGARIVVYQENGSLVANSEPIGQGFRWRHQLAVGQFIESGPQEIAVIRTPHIGGVIEIYAVEQDCLVIRAELSGYSSHQIGSHNLDSALAADFDGNGQIEIVVPDQSQTVLSGIEMVGMELKVAWEAPVGDRMCTNLAAVNLADGRLALGVGSAGGILRIWHPGK